MTDQGLAVVEAVPQNVALPSKEEFQDQVDRAGEIAKILAGIIEQQNLSVKIGAGNHVMVEAWQTLAEATGFTIATREIGHDDMGFLAEATLIRTRDGTVVSTATHRCGGPGDGEWPSRAAHEQSSMAQTRASSKVARNKLSWVVVMAGYKPTPAEEMPREARRSTSRSNQGRSAPGMICPTHGEEVWKRGAMKNYAHKNEDGSWCNDYEGRQAPSEAPERSREPRKPASPQPEPSPANEIDPKDFRDPGDLMYAVNTRWGKSVAEVRGVLGVEDMGDIKDLVDAWRQLEKMWGRRDQKTP